jgi:hypothetical protein
MSLWWIDVAICKRNEESVNYLLLYCDVAYAIWIVFSVILVCLELCLDV